MPAKINCHQYVAHHSVNGVEGLETSATAIAASPGKSARNEASFSSENRVMGV